MSRFGSASWVNVWPHETTHLPEPPPAEKSISQKWYPGWGQGDSRSQLQTLASLEQPLVSWSPCLCSVSRSLSSTRRPERVPRQEWVW